MAKIIPAQNESYLTLLKFFNSHEIAAIPTETVYGLAANAFDRDAITNVFMAKERPAYDPLIVHVKWTKSNFLSHLEQQELIDASKLGDVQRKAIEALMHKFWPGALTFILPKNAKVPDIVTSGLDTVGVRMPKHAVTQALLDVLPYPLVAPSANRFGRISPTTAAHVESEIGDRIEYILDGGPSEIGLESTVVHVDAGGLVHVLRPGGVSFEEIEGVVGKAHVKVREPGRGIGNGGEQEISESPGQLLQHYAPAAPLYLLPHRLEDLGTPQKKDEFESFILEVLKLERERIVQNKKIGFLAQRGEVFWNRDLFKAITNTLLTKIELGHLTVQHFAESLSMTGELKENAHNLFSGLRALDEKGLSLIFAEPNLNKNGLGLAITDRLFRASVKKT